MAGMASRSDIKESVDIPDDVLYALKQKPGALEAFRALSVEEQRESLEMVTSATMSGMRDGRIDRLIEKLSK
jgi:uncharacterized protein YdeI (YjbR/CyaY-like superfamily)